MATPPSVPGSVNPQLLKAWGLTLAKRKDIALAFGIILMIVILILPLPTWLLDVALAVSITFSVLVLMTTIFIEKPIQFTSFPLLLLITTLFRLALNLSSTRLILSDGYKGPSAAGNVIAAFGGFIMRGNFIIGVIVFAILVLVNFMVITKGSGRIAEVAARFSLDAMPGKQMAIDADLSAGLIEQNEATRRREELNQESSFYGAMDGASKFVRGDAIAGLIITAINIIAGILIGILQRNMDFMKAASTYMQLTVGDGLVSQVPALIISVAAGIMVSKAGISGGTEKVLFGQLSHYPKSLGMTSFLSLMLATLPGTPAAPFTLLALVTGGIAYYLWQSQIKAEEAAKQAALKAPATPPPPVETPIEQILKMDLVRLELGYNLLSLINDTTNRRLTDQIKALRRNIALELGFLMPSVRIQDNMRLEQNTYVIYIKDTEAGRGTLRPNKLLVMDPKGQEITLPGEKTEEPTFGLPATWIDLSSREDAVFRNYTVVDCPTIITTHITELIKASMSELLSFTETQKLIDCLGDDQKALKKDMAEKKVSVSIIQSVLQRLLTERVSIRDLPTILEAICEVIGMTQSMTVLTEYVRQKLARQISNANVGPDGILQFIALSGDWEKAFQSNLSGSGDDKVLTLPPTDVTRFIGAINKTFEEAAMKGENPVLMVSSAIRPYVRQIVERFRPSLTVMSQGEIHARVKIRSVGTVL